MKLTLKITGLVKTKKVIFVIFISFLFFAGIPGKNLWANNLSITNVSLEDRHPAQDTAVVEFDISWDNAWKYTGAPMYEDLHDAVWVFIKDGYWINSAWRHAKLKTSGTNPADSDPGDGTDVDIIVPTDRRGAFIRLANEATSKNVRATNVRLTIDYGAAPVSKGDTENITLNVLGVEMVYIPAGQFKAGDGTFGEAQFKDAANTSAAVTVSTTSRISQKSDGTGTAGDITWTSKGFSGQLPASRTAFSPTFPIGTDAFYAMKYELSQREYMRFINSINASGKPARVTETQAYYFAFGSGGLSMSNRNAIKNLGDVVHSDYDNDNIMDENVDGEWIAMNYLSWPDFAAWCDWAALRPLTELEYEKMADGGIGYEGPAGAYAWGTTDLLLASSGIVNEGQNDEVSSTSGDGLAVYYTSANSGPFRVGFAAATNTNRVSSGAGLYGNMELSGNVAEWYVHISGTTVFNGIEGDGMIGSSGTGDGFADCTTASTTSAQQWPGCSSDGFIKGFSQNVGLRGGAWDTTSGPLQVADRQFAGIGKNITADNGRNYAAGGRAGRTAP